MDKVCACCGQTLPPESPEDLVLKPQHRAIVERIRRAGQYGINSDVLFDYLYADDFNGGPDSGKTSMYVRINYINKKLKPFGKVIRAPQGGNAGGSTSYVLRDL
jgi:hypothetical protein